MDQLIVSETHRFNESNRTIIYQDGSIKPYDNIDTKIEVYEARVKEWFLDVAKNLVGYGISRGDYAAVMITLSFIEGIEKFKCGNEIGGSRFIFKKSAAKIFPGVNQKIISRLYDETRCGLFHSGFPDGKIYLSHDRNLPIYTEDKRIFINPLKFTEKIIQYFDNYITELKNPFNENSREKFEFLWDKLWNKS